MQPGNPPDTSSKPQAPSARRSSAFAMVISIWCSSALRFPPKPGMNSLSSFELWVQTCPWLSSPDPLTSAIPSRMRRSETNPGMRCSRAWANWSRGGRLAGDEDPSVLAHRRTNAARRCADCPPLSRDRLAAHGVGRPALAALQSRRILPGPAGSDHGGTCTPGSTLPVPGQYRSVRRGATTSLRPLPAGRESEALHELRRGPPAHSRHRRAGRDSGPGFRGLQQPARHNGGNAVTVRHGSDIATELFRLPVELSACLPERGAPAEPRIPPELRSAAYRRPCLDRGRQARPSPARMVRRRPADRTRHPLPLPPHPRRDRRAHRRFPRNRLPHPAWLPHSETHRTARLGGLRLQSPRPRGLRAYFFPGLLTQPSSDSCSVPRNRGALPIPRAACTDPSRPLRTG